MIEKKKRKKKRDIAPRCNPCVTHSVLGPRFMWHNWIPISLQQKWVHACRKPMRSTSNWATLCCEPLPSFSYTDVNVRHPWMTEMKWNELAPTLFSSFFPSNLFSVSRDWIWGNHPRFSLSGHPWIALKVVQFEQRKRCRLDWWRRFWTNSITFRNTWAEKKKKKKKRTILNPSLVPPSTPSTSSTTTILSPKTRFFKNPTFLVLI